MKAFLSKHWLISLALLAIVVLFLMNGLTLRLNQSLLSIAKTQQDQIRWYQAQLWGIQETNQGNSDSPLY